MIKCSKIREFLFKCDSCDVIITIDMEDEEHIEDINNDDVIFDCDCGGTYFVLRN